MPGKDPGGIIITIIIGILGSIVATYLGQAMGLYRAGEPAGFIGAVIGAMLLLFLLSPGHGPKRLAGFRRLLLPSSHRTVAVSCR